MNHPELESIEGSILPPSANTNKKKKWLLIIAIIVVIVVVIIVAISSNQNYNRLFDVKYIEYVNDDEMGDLVADKILTFEDDYEYDNSYTLYEITNKTNKVFSDVYVIIKVDGKPKYEYAEYVGKIRQHETIEYKSYYRDTKAEADRIGAVLFLSNAEIVDINWSGRTAPNKANVIEHLRDKSKPKGELIRSEKLETDSGVIIIGEYKDGTYLAGTIFNGNCLADEGIYFALIYSHFLEKGKDFSITGMTVVNGENYLLSVVVTDGKPFSMNGLPEEYTDSTNENYSDSLYKDIVTLGDLLKKF